MVVVVTDPSDEIRRHEVRAWHHENGVPRHTVDLRISAEAGRRFHGELIEHRIGAKAQRECWNTHAESRENVVSGAVAIVEGPGGNGCASAETEEKLRTRRRCRRRGGEHPGQE